MKLIRYTNRRLAILLFILLVIWGIFFYITILKEIMEETDDTLRNYREIIIKEALANPDIVKFQASIMQSYIFRPIPEETALIYKERLFNSVTYIQSEDVYEPVRVLKTCFRSGDNLYYELEIKISTLKRDDMLRAIFIYLFILYAALLISILIGTRLILKQSFTPLTNLLTWLHQLVPGKPAPPLNMRTKIREFRRLNEAALSMYKLNRESYEEQKKFIENASHEIQTPLAVARNKLELMAENPDVTERQLVELEEIYETLGKAVRINKSLLLLSRITNDQYHDKTRIETGKIIEEILNGLKDVYEYKQLHIDLQLKEECILIANEILTQILISNLIKNAILHTGKEGEINIVLKKKSLTVSNTGSKPLDKEKIFTRFHREESSKKDSTGLGLAIIKSIADLYHYKIDYTFTDKHIFTVRFPVSD